MAAGAWKVYDYAKEYFADGTHDLDNAALGYKMALFLSTSNIGAASTTYAGVTNEHANANGYTTGGTSILPSIGSTFSPPASSTKLILSFQVIARRLTCLPAAMASASM